MSARAAVTTLLLTAIAACSSTTSSRNSDDSPPEASSAAVLEVDNASSVDMEIAVVRERNATPLGMAPAGETTRFKLPQPVLTGGGAMQFIGRPLGQRGEPVASDIQPLVSPGETIQWRIPPQ